MTDLARALASIKAGPAVHYAEAFATAIHEAAHAVCDMCAAVGIDHVFLKVEEDERGGWGSVRVVGGGVCTSDYRPAPPFATVCGYIAESLAGCPARPFEYRFHSADLTRARADCLSDAEYVRAEQEARSLLLREWRAVTAVADALLTHGYLDGDTAEALVIRNLTAQAKTELNLWGWQPPAPPRDPEYEALLGEIAAMEERLRSTGTTLAPADDGDDDVESIGVDYDDDELQFAASGELGRMAIGALSIQATLRPVAPAADGWPAGGSIAAKWRWFSRQQ